MWIWRRPDSKRFTSRKKNIESVRRAWLVPFPLIKTRQQQSVSRSPHSLLAFSLFTDHLKVSGPTQSFWQNVDQRWATPSMPSPRTSTCPNRTHSNPVHCVSLTFSKSIYASSLFLLYSQSNSPPHLIIPHASLRACQALKFSCGLLHSLHQFPLSVVDNLSAISDQVGLKIRFEWTKEKNWRLNWCCGCWPPCFPSFTLRRSCFEWDFWKILI